MTPIELQAMSQLQKESRIQNTELEAAIQNLNRTSSFVRTEELGKMEARFSVRDLVRIRLPANLPSRKNIHIYSWAMKTCNKGDQEVYRNANIYIEFLEG